MRRRLSALVLLLVFINIAAVPFAQLAALRQMGGKQAQGRVNGTVLEVVVDLLFDVEGDADDPSGPLDEESGPKSTGRIESRLDLYNHLFSFHFLALHHSTLAGTHVEHALLEPDRDRFVPPPRL